MLRASKLLALRAAKSVSGCAAVRESRWRGERLLILCYHGISLEDEHCWNPELYLPASLFEQRLAAVCDEGYNVLPLGDALRRLYAGELPPRSVCLTFDDGFHDFFAAAYPLLEKYGIPATVYLTSFYSGYQRPVFDVMCSYLLWKGRDRALNTSRFCSGGGVISLAERSTRDGLAADIRRFVRKEDYSAEQKDEFLRGLALHLGIDYGALVHSRILQLMSASEIGRLDPQLVQVELHTHRHRVPLDKELFQREVLENRHYVNFVTNGRTNPSHFCYPSGMTSAVFLPWLRELGIVSATTCRPGLASRTDDPLILPRFLDSCSVSPIEFEGWLAGLASKLPRRRLTVPEPTTIGIFA
jgi:peptidoglycan/xylan/chitin deacetylase (PgdA/CDA1 family)